MSWFRRRSGATADDGHSDDPAGPRDDAVGADAGGADAGGADAGGADAGGADAGGADAGGADAGGADAVGVDAVGADGGGEPSVDPAPDRSAGPFDASEVDDDVQRIDLGALRVPARPGTELRLEVEEQTKRVVAATIATQGSTLQLQVFAAPRTDGVWAEIRAEIATQVGKQGGSAEEVTGPFGRELMARLPARTEDGRTGHRAARFVGVDGPRWFLRGVISGSAAVEQSAATDLEAMLRGTVVVRGGEAMAPRDLIALTLPPAATRVAGVSGVADTVPGTQPDTDAVAGGDAAGGDAAAGADTPDSGAPPARPRLAPPERGPEITERR